MKKNKTKKAKRISKGKMLAIGAGVAAVGAGAYYFLGPKGKKHQNKFKRELKVVKKVAKKAISKGASAIKKEIKKDAKKVAKRIRR